MTKNETNEINLTPDFGRMFDLMLAEASRQGQAKSIFGDILPQRQELDALRAYQRFLAPLAIAANAMTTREAVERFRDAVTELSSGLARFADQLEREIAEDDADPTGGKGLL